MCLDSNDQMAFSLKNFLFIGLTLVLQQIILFVPYPSHDQILFFFFCVKKLGSITIFSQKAIVCGSHFMFFLTFFLTTSPALLFFFFFAKYF